MIYRRIAVAVIGQAWFDALASGLESEWHTARMFFDSGGPLFRMWCAWADLDAEAVQTQFTHAITERVAGRQDRRRRTRQWDSTTTASADRR